VAQNERRRHREPSEPAFVEVVNIGSADARPAHAHQHGAGVESGTARSSNAQILDACKTAANMVLLMVG